MAGRRHAWRTERGETTVTPDIAIAGPAAPVRHKPEGISAAVALILILLAGLPLAVWLDLRELSEYMLRGQAEDLSVAINHIRDYYSRNVVGRVLAAHGAAQVSPNYLDIPGAIPIPATLSLELGQVISAEHAGIGYRFFSDFPFASRAAHSFDDFERQALAALRQDPSRAISDASGTIFDRRVRLVTPIVMGGECVACHNARPDSPKRDWKVGDVRGIQEITVQRPFAANIFAFKYLLIYFVCAALTGLAFIAMQRRQSSMIRRVNSELERANSFLAAVSAKIAKYLSPQLYRSIFSGERDVVIATERKRLTIFFSDLADFTALSERLQPEELTHLLNEYFTEMSAIAIRHGGTIDKFIGDAMLVFFGDPETKGAAEDARACLQMAVEMQHRLAALNAKWHGEGIEAPIRARIGINTGYCNVGNFGSEDRMDYTIIGAEANLAARLQEAAEPGGIVLGYETYALVRAEIRARPLPAITMKGIARPVVPYAVEGLTGAAGEGGSVISERAAGLDLFLDLGLADRATLDRALRLLHEAIDAQAARRGGPARG
jgi:adenylate cyclase